MSALAAPADALANPATHERLVALETTPLSGDVNGGGRVIAVHLGDLYLP
jgi:hypothetical protein